MAKKVYAVKNGRIPGIYRTWEECQKQVLGYSGPVYKGFSTVEEAQAFLDGSNAPVLQASDAEAVAYVDGSYNKLTGDFSYGMVILHQGTEITFCEKIHDETLAQMHNVAGEIKGAEAAMRYALEKGFASLAIYHDYEGIAKWCTGEWKTNREGTKNYKAYYDSICDRLQITFVKVKGHSNDKYNDMADALAKKALGIG